MIKVTTSEPYSTMWVPLSKVVNFVELDGRVHVSVIDLPKSIQVVESMDEIESRVDKIMIDRKNF